MQATRSQKPSQNGSMVNRSTVSPTILGEIAGAMRRYNIEGHPRNFDLVYNVFHGNNQPLRDAFIKLGQDKSQPKLDELIKLHLLEAMDVEEVASQSIETISTEISELLDTLSTEREALSEFRQLLLDVSQKVGPEANIDPARIRHVMQVVSTATKKKIAAGEEITKQIDAQSKRVQSVSSELDRYKEQKFKDSLTGLANRRAFNKKLVSLYSDEQFKQATVVLLKMDSYSLLKERFGAIMCDKLVVRLADLTNAQMPDCDHISYRGEGSFGLVFLSENSNRIDFLLERTREAVLASPIISQKSSEMLHQVTISSGVVDARYSDNVGELNRKLNFAASQAAEKNGNKVFHLEEKAKTASIDHPQRQELLMYSDN